MEMESKMTHMLRLANKNFEATIMLKDIRKNIVTINKPLGNLSTKRDTLKMNQTLGPRNTVSET